jgi:ribosomal protein L33
MASKNRILIRLQSTAGTGVFYTTEVNPKNLEGGKLKNQKKYDWKLRKVVEFKQTGITKKKKK